MNDGDNELTKALRADWAELGADATLPSEDLDRVDAGTRAAVEWMRAGWDASHDSSVPPLPLELARRLSRRRAARTRRRASAAVLVAAASLLAILRIMPPKGAPSEIAPGAPHVEPDRIPSVVPKVDLAPLRAASRITDLQPDEYIERPDGVEFVQGNVRIVLLDH